MNLSSLVLVVCASASLACAGELSPSDFSDSTEPGGDAARDSAHGDARSPDDPADSGRDEREVGDALVSETTTETAPPPATEAGPAETGGASGLSCSNEQWWNTPIGYGPYMSGGWWDTDMDVSADSKIQIRHASRLDKEGVYDWGWMPEFTDQVTGQRFRFLHLRPFAKYTTVVGTTYPAGTVVGLSGGDTPETGYPDYSTGEHLCVQTLAKYRDVFPKGKDPCK